MSVKLPWWEWLLSSPYTLKARGVNPAHRLAQTGHSRAMSLHWARTIGMWCCATADQIRKTSGTAAAAFNVFQQRNGLFTKTLSRRRNYSDYSEAEYDLLCEVMTASMAHAMIWDYLGRYPGSSVGAAAHRLTGRVSRDHKVPLKKRPLVPHSSGILPIEAVVYYHAVNVAIEEAAWDPIKWLAMADNNDLRAWTQLRMIWINTSGPQLCRLPDDIEKA